MEGMVLLHKPRHASGFRQTHPSKTHQKTNCLQANRAEGKGESDVGSKTRLYPRTTVRHGRRAPGEPRACDLRRGVRARLISAT